MIRRLRQQQQKSHDTKSKSIPSAVTNVTPCSSNSTTSRNSNSHSTYTTSSPVYGHTFPNPEEEGRAISYTRPPPLIEIESPLKGLSKLPSSNVIAPPNAIAPSSLKSRSDSRFGYVVDKSSRFIPTKVNKDFRPESSRYNSTQSAGYPHIQGITESVRVLTKLLWPLL